MKNVIQATLLILIAALTVLAAASSHPARQAKRQIRSGKHVAPDSTDMSGCAHQTDLFIYEPQFTSVINH